MQTNLGRCHYGRDDDAMLVGARIDGPGWIGVCNQHRDDAERDGYVLHELAVVDDGIPEMTAATAEPAVGLDIFDDPYPQDAGASPLR